LVTIKEGREKLKEGRKTLVLGFDENVKNTLSFF